MKRKGFTLIEMTVVLFIISLLILIIIPNLGAQKSMLILYTDLQWFP